MFRAPIFRHRTDKNGFSLGFSKNLRQVFGDEKKYWLLPVFSRYTQFLMLALLKLLNNQDSQGLGVVSFFKEDGSDIQEKNQLFAVGIFF